MQLRLAPWQVDGDRRNNVRMTVTTWSAIQLVPPPPPPCPPPLHHFHQLHPSLTFIYTSHTSQTLIHTHSHKYTHMHTHTHMHTNTQTRTQIHKNVSNLVFYIQLTITHMHRLTHTHAHKHMHTPNYLCQWAFIGQITMALVMVKMASTQSNIVSSLPPPPYSHHIHTCITTLPLTIGCHLIHTYSTNSLHSATTASTPVLIKFINQPASYTSLLILPFFVFPL